MKALTNAAFVTTKSITRLTATAMVLLVALIYWPVTHAQFVWDDILDFQQNAWLTHGNGWQDFIFHQFNGWTNYFRPLVVAMFTIEVRAFDVEAAPMHAVSLIVHLINTVLVGTLATHLCAGKWPLAKRWHPLALSMLLYGLHPLLVEPVVWIGCQFDLMATLFMLLGLVLNASISRCWPRAISVAICFFLAACAKESAATFPLILVVIDWLMLDVPTATSRTQSIQIMLKRNWPAYALLFGAALAYLTLRYWALGSLALEAGGDRLSSLARIQQASFLYLRYWCMFFWPMVGMGPVHPIATAPFFTYSPALILKDIAALGIAALGIALTFRRSYMGGLILVVTLALLPVLHIVAANLDSSLYHERYAMTALAMACSLLPLSLREIPIPASIERTTSLASVGVLCVWSMLAIMNIRQMVPLWSSQVKLWQWAGTEYPNDIDVQDQLISAYMGVGDNAKAMQLINKVAAEEVSCTTCMLNGASLAVREGNTALATFFLGKIDVARELPSGVIKYRYYRNSYLNTRAELLILQGNFAAAEQVLREAIAADSLNPQPQLVLATTLALQGKVDEAKRVEISALPLLEPDERIERHQAFLKLLTSLPAGAKMN